MDKRLLWALVILVVIGLVRACNYYKGTSTPLEPQKPSYDEVKAKIEKINKQIENAKTKQDTISIDSAIRVLGWK